MTAGAPTVPAAEPVVTVVVSAYNHAPFVAQALDSVLAQQTRFPFEIIVSEDCSTDGTRAIVEEYARLHAARIRVMLSPGNLNTNVVVRRAIEAARGRYVATLDADDYWTAEDKLQAQVDRLEASPASAVCFHDALVVDRDGVPIEEHYVPAHMSATTRLDDIVMGNYVPSCSAMFRRDSVEALPAWFDSAPFGDWPLLILAATRGPLAYIDRRLAAYRRHGGGVWSGLSETDRIRAIIGFLCAVEEPLASACGGLVRRSRTQWRVHLLDHLEARGDGEAIAAEVAGGARCGDLAHARSGDGPSVDPRPGIGIAFGALAPVSARQGGSFGHVDDVRVHPGRRSVVIRGWARVPDADPCPTLVVEVEPLAADAVAVRLARPDVASAVSPDLGFSGFWLRVSSNEPLGRRLGVGVRSSSGEGRTVDVVDLE